MARLPTGRASTTGLAGARVLFRQLQAQGSARRSRQSGRVVTTTVYLSLGAIQRKALPTKPTGSGIQQNPAYGLVDNASFLFFQNPRHRPLGILRKVQGPQVRLRPTDILKLLPPPIVLTGSSLTAIERQLSRR